MFGAADPDDLVATWSDGLAGFDAEDVRYALQQMQTAFQDFPPTLFQFAGMCRDSRRRRAQSSDAKALTGPKEPMPDHVKAQLAEFIAVHTFTRDGMPPERKP